MREALVPILLWQDVPVVKAVRRRLTVLERFVLTAALELRPLTLRDLNEVTGLQTEWVEPVLYRLRLLRLFDVEYGTPGDGSDPAVDMGPGTLDGTGLRYVADEQAVRAALAAEETVEHRPGKQSFLLLPDTAELFAVDTEARQQGIHLLHRVGQAGQVPTAQGLAGVPRATFMRERVQAGQVANLNEDVVEVQDIDLSAIPESCPVYRCRGLVAADQGSGV